MTTRESFQINGVIDTNNSVLDNLELIASSAGCWWTYDTNAGMWCVVINQEGTSTSSFNDSNIIGAITISGTGLTDYYNQVKVDYPHKDLLDERDSSFYRLDAIDWPSFNPMEFYNNEQLNCLELKFDLVNDPTQAEMLALMALKQSRVDKVIKFSTDYSKLGLKAGDLIDITSSMYGFTNKVFRILSIEEEDSEDGSINLGITALEYDSRVYEFGDLNRFARTPRNGIKQKKSNTALATADDQAYGDNLLRMLLPLGLSELFNLLFSKNPLTGKITAKLEPKVNEGVMVNPATVSGDTQKCKGQTATVTASYACCVKDGSKIPYKITGVSSAEIGVPLEGTVTFTNKTGTLAIPITADGVINAPKVMTVSFGGDTGCGSHAVTIYSLKPYTISASASPSTINEGQSSTITVTTTNITDGTTIPYEVTGTATISGSTTGSVTITGNTGSFTLSTSDVNKRDPSEAVVTFGQASSLVVQCCTDDVVSVTITVTGTGTGPSLIPASTGCNYVEIPISWCGVYNAAGNLIGVEPSGTASALAAFSGGPSVTVPLTATVSAGSPSTISIATSIQVDGTTTGKPGFPTNVITSFNSAAVGSKIITGTTTQIITN